MSNVIILPVQNMTITDTETGKETQSKIYTLSDNLTPQQLDSILSQLGK